MKKHSEILTIIRTYRKHTHVPLSGCKKKRVLVGWSADRKTVVIGCAVCQHGIALDLDKVRRGNDADQ